MLPTLEKVSECIKKLVELMIFFKHRCRRELRGVIKEDLESRSLNSQVNTNETPLDLRVVVKKVLCEGFKQPVSPSFIFCA